MTKPFLVKNGFAAFFPDQAMLLEISLGPKWHN